MTIQGTVHRKSVTDYFMRCIRCGKVFYFSHDYCNGKNVACPYCGHIH